MELTRVTGRAEQRAAGVAAGGDADLLAMLLGGDQGTASAFPATLEAALAAGGTAEEPIAIGDGEDGGDAATLAPDDSGSPIDVALAAALALASAVATATPATADAAAETATDGDVAADAAAGVAATAGGVAAAVVVDATAPATGTVTGSGAAAAPAATSTEAQLLAAAAARQSTIDAKGQAATANAAASATEHSAESAAATKTTSDDAKALTTEAKPIVDLAARAAGHEAAATATATAESTKSARPHGNEAGQHGAGAGVEIEKKTAAFSSGGGEQHGLDLGSSDRHPSAAVEAAAQVPVSTTATGTPGEAIHVTRPEGAVGGVAAPVTTTPAPSTATQEPAATRVERPLHHPGTIEARWGERVTDAVRLSALRGGGEIRLQLEPEGLGHIDVRLHLQSDGVRAVIVAEHESTRALLTSQQHVLQDAFNRSDLRLSGFSVDVGSGGGAATFAQADERGQGGGQPSAPSAPATTTNGAESVETAAAPLANGRVSVRV